MIIDEIAITAVSSIFSLILILYRSNQSKGIGLPAFLGYLISEFVWYFFQVASGNRSQMPENGFVPWLITSKLLV